MFQKFLVVISIIGGCLKFFNCKKIKVDILIQQFDITNLALVTYLQDMVTHGPENLYPIIV